MWVIAFVSALVVTAAKESAEVFSEMLAGTDDDNVLEVELLQHFQRKYPLYNIPFRRSAQDAELMRLELEALVKVANKVPHAALGLAQVLYIYGYFANPIYPLKAAAKFSEAVDFKADVCESATTSDAAFRDEACEARFMNAIMLYTNCVNQNLGRDAIPTSTIMEPNFDSLKRSYRERAHKLLRRMLSLGRYKYLRGATKWQSTGQELTSKNTSPPPNDHPGVDHDFVGLSNDRYVTAGIDMIHYNQFWFMEKDDYRYFPTPFWFGEEEKGKDMIKWMEEQLYPITKMELEKVIKDTISVGSTGTRLVGGESVDSHDLSMHALFISSSHQLFSISSPPSSLSHWLSGLDSHQVSPSSGLGLLISCCSHQLFSSAVLHQLSGYLASAFSLGVN